jgi:hypothetical protein
VRRPPARAMATITALPTADLVDEARYERDATKPGGYGEAAGARWHACASVRRRVVVVGGGGRMCAWARGCVCVHGCAGAFLIPGQGQVHRNPAYGWFNVRKQHGKWVGQVIARGVRLRTSGHAEAWRAAVELEWLLDRWCRKHGACGAVGAACCRRGIVRAAVWAQGLRGAS